MPRSVRAFNAAYWSSNEARMMQRTQFRLDGYLDSYLDSCRAPEGPKGDLGLGGWRLASAGGASPSLDFEGPGRGEQRATILRRSPPGGDGAVEGGSIAVSSLSAAFFDPSRHLAGSCVRGMPFTEIILVTGATLRTVMSRCGELVQTSRGYSRAEKPQDQH